MKHNHSKLAKKVKVWGVSCEFSLKKSNKNSRLRRNIPFALAVGALAPPSKIRNDAINNWPYFISNWLKSDVKLLGRAKFCSCLVNLASKILKFI